MIDSRPQQTERRFGRLLYYTEPMNLPNTRRPRIAIPGLLATAFVMITAMGCGARSVSFDGGIDALRVMGDSNLIEIIAIPVDARDVLVADRGVPDSARPDVISPPPTGCRQSSDCGGDPSAMCLTTFPGGLCTHRCMIDANCGGGSVCLQNLCFPGCTPEGLECSRFGGDCTQFDAMNPERRACVPGCFESDRLPPGTPACAAPLVCNPWVGSCGDRASVPPPGIENGGPCMSDSQCRGGRCLPESDDPARARGVLGGYCLSYGRRPSDGDYDPGLPIPQSNCPSGSGVLPFENTLEGDRTFCLRTCRLDGNECRPGYFCTPLGDPGMPFATNGACLPVDCLMMPMACPAGYVCRTNMVMGGEQHVCSH